MARSKRVMYHDLGNGRVSRTFYWDAIKAKSAVVLTAVEWLERRELEGAYYPHLGDATVYVTNVLPRDPIRIGGFPFGGGSSVELFTGHVEFYLHVEGASGDNETNVVVTVSVLDEIEDPPFVEMPEGL